MLTRIGRIVAFTAAGVLAAIGLLAYPSVMLTVAGLAVLFVGPLTAMCAFSADPFRGTALRLGAAAAATVLALSTVVAGLVALLGPAAGTVIALLTLAAGLWTWRRGRCWWAQVSNRLAARPSLRRGPTPGGAARHMTRPAPSPSQLPAVLAGSGSATELCAAWRRTYWLLRDLPPASPERGAVVEVRQQLLDEIERRDPDGFARWMQTEPRAGSDPGRYLTVDH